MDGIDNDQVQGSHQYNQGKEKDGSSKFIGHEDYYPTLSGKQKPFQYSHWV